MNLRNFLLTTTVALLYSVVPAGLTLAQRPAPPIRYTLNYYDTDGYVVATTHLTVPPISPNTGTPKIMITKAPSEPIPHAAVRGGKLA